MEFFEAFGRLEIQESQLPNELLASVWPDVAISRHLGNFPRPFGAFFLTIYLLLGYFHAKFLLTDGNFFLELVYCWAIFCWQLGSFSLKLSGHTGWRLEVFCSGLEALKYWEKISLSAKPLIISAVGRKQWENENLRKTLSIGNHWSKHFQQSKKNSCVECDPLLVFYLLLKMEHTIMPYFICSLEDTTMYFEWDNI